MAKHETTAEFELLASAANLIKPDLYKDHSAWKESPFEWIVYLPSGSKGRLGKRLVSQWCALKGLSVSRSSDFRSRYDRQ